jgi:hypothetical protein
MERNQSLIQYIVSKLPNWIICFLVICLIFGLGIYYIPLDKLEYLGNHIPGYIWTTLFFVVVVVVLGRIVCGSTIKSIIMRLDRYKVRDDKFYQEKDKHNNMRIEAIEGRMDNIETKIDLVLEHDKQLCETNENVKEMLTLMTNKLV